MESIGYGMPAFKYKLMDFVTSRGTIRFTLDKPLSDSQGCEIIQTRMVEIDSA